MGRHEFDVYEDSGGQPDFDIDKTFLRKSLRYDSIEVTSVEPNGKSQGFQIHEQKPKGISKLANFNEKTYFLEEKHKLKKIENRSWRCWFSNFREEYSYKLRSRSGSTLEEKDLHTAYILDLKRNNGMKNKKRPINHCIQLLDKLHQQFRNFDKLNLSPPNFS